LLLLKIDFEHFLQRHKIPISAIPCLNYKKALEAERQASETSMAVEETEVNSSTVDNSTTSGQESESTKMDSKDDQGKTQTLFLFNTCVWFPVSRHNSKK
jgi:hypothetical protein